MSLDERREDGVETEATGLAERELEEGEVVFLEEDPSGGDVKQLRARCKELEDEGDRLKELYLRKLADFDNYRKRQEREMDEFKRLANAGLLRDCLPVLDNLERALSAPGSDGSGLRTGVELTLRQLKDVLGRYGLSEIDPAGQPFDPTHHEAIQRREAAEVAENTVLQVMQKGYLLGDRLLRPALVVVAVAPPSAPAPSPEPQTPPELLPRNDPFDEDGNG
jgi:molecular chaperone GrpE